MDSQTELTQLFDNIEDKIYASFNNSFWNIKIEDEFKTKFVDVLNNMYTLVTFKKFINSLNKHKNITDSIKQIDDILEKIECDDNMMDHVMEMENLREKIKNSLGMLSMCPSYYLIMVNAISFILDRMIKYNYMSISDINLLFDKNNDPNGVRFNYSHYLEIKNILNLLPLYIKAYSTSKVDDIEFYDTELLYEFIEYIEKKINKSEISIISF